MKSSKLKSIIFSLSIAACLSLALSLSTSCDTPKSIAWSYYYCALDTLKAGDPDAARHFLDKCNKDSDPSLRTKADSLMKVIEKETNRQ